MKRADKNKLVLKEIIDKMFEIAGHPLKFEDVEGRTDDWYQQYTMTESQNEDWRNWGTKFIMKKYRYNKFIADREMRWIDLYCGLKISDSKYEREETTKA